MSVYLGLAYIAIITFFAGVVAILFPRTGMLLWAIGMLGFVFSLFNSLGVWYWLVKFVKLFLVICIVVWVIQLIVSAIKGVERHFNIKQFGIATGLFFVLIFLWINFANMADMKLPRLLDEMGEMHFTQGAKWTLILSAGPALAMQLISIVVSKIFSRRKAQAADQE